MSNENYLLERVIIIRERGQHAFFYGDEGHETWPKHIQKQKTQKEVKGFFIDKYYLVTMSEYLWHVCPEMMRQLNGHD